MRESTYRVERVFGHFAPEHAQEVREVLHRHWGFGAEEHLGALACVLLVKKQRVAGLSKRALFIQSNE